jgi:hypothetical protein
MPPSVGGGPSEARPTLGPMGVGCVLLIVGSALLQIVGLGLVARDLWRIQHQTFGVPVWMRRVRVGVLRLLGRSTAQTVELKGAMSASFSMRGRGTVRRPPGNTMEERVAALEANFGHLERDMQGYVAELREQAREAEARVTELRVHMDQLEHEREQARHRDLRETLPWQWIGTGLFAVGALLAMWGSLAC